MAKSERDEEFEAIRRDTPAAVQAIFFVSMIGCGAGSHWGQIGAAIGLFAPMAIGLFLWRRHVDRRLRRHGSR